MNPRIRELAHEAGLPTYNPDGIPTKLEKFAELIVNECAMLANEHVEESEGVHFGVGRAIKNHFGVDQ
jgi:hypothetical protein